MPNSKSEHGKEHTIHQPVHDFKFFSKPASALVYRSAARFGYLESFVLLFEPFGNQYFDLATLKFGYFSKFFKKPILTILSIIFKALMYIFLTFWRPDVYLLKF